MFKKFKAPKFHPSGSRLLGIMGNVVSVAFLPVNMWETSSCVNVVSLPFSFYTDVTPHVCREERGGDEGELFFFMVVCLSFKTPMEQKNEICQLLVGSFTHSRLMFHFLVSII